MKAGLGCSSSARAQSSWSGFLRSVMVKVMSGMLWLVSAVRGWDLGSHETLVGVFWENLPRRKGYLADIPIPYEFSLFHLSSSLCPFCSADIIQS